MKEDKISQAGDLHGAPLARKPKPSHRILVVDDEPDIRRLNAEVLIGSGYHVDAVEDGAVAWDVLQRNSYDLLVTDNNMPKVSGIKLLKKLHAVRMSMPVILMSGTMPTEELKRHPWLQIDATLLKPYTIAELLGNVKEVLRTTDGFHDQAAPTDWQSQPSIVGLRA